MHNVIQHSVDNRDLARYLDELNRKLRILTDKICCLIGDGATPVTQTTVSGVNTSVPAGLKSVSITKTDATGTAVNITLSDGSVFPLTVQYETFVDAASLGGNLPAYTISGGTWKWHGIK